MKCRRCTVNEIIGVVSGSHDKGAFALDVCYECYSKVRDYVLHPEDANKTGVKDGQRN